MAEVEAALAEGTPSGEATGTEAVANKLGAEALAALEERIRQELGDEANGIGARVLVRVRVDQILVQQHQVPSFEQWQQQNPG